MPVEWNRLTAIADRGSIRDFQAFACPIKIEVETIAFAALRTVFRAEPSLSHLSVVGMRRPRCSGLHRIRRS